MPWNCKKVGERIGEEITDPSQLIGWRNRRLEREERQRQAELERQRDIERRRAAGEIIPEDEAPANASPSGTRRRRRGSPPPDMRPLTERRMTRAVARALGITATPGGLPDNDIASTPTADDDEGEAPDSPLASSPIMTSPAVLPVASAVDVDEEGSRDAEIVEEGLIEFDSDNFNHEGEANDHDSNHDDVSHEDVDGDDASDENASVTKARPTITILAARPVVAPTPAPVFTLATAPTPTPAFVPAATPVPAPAFAPLVAPVASPADSMEAVIATDTAPPSATVPTTTPAAMEAPAVEVEEHTAAKLSESVIGGNAPVQSVVASTAAGNQQMTQLASGQSEARVKAAYQLVPVVDRINRLFLESLVTLQSPTPEMVTAEARLFLARAQENETVGAVKKAATLLSSITQGKIEELTRRPVQFEVVSEILRQRLQQVFLQELLK
ncbi:hypothetical protein B0T20DRAFT_484213 [Sordaria brevicollis]|uniref:Uncharacterized protein n=1 Tax=Sordaria brevicollis TaxID=83679 RepID=A0AAE0U2J4_SORBR|nr:hypothetical protein B0T20DRAFT_484213 [Sordaria brevicollis]